ncbi:MAG: hypothetical protein ACF8OB_10075, partial [Phycisphaeraceae bacterium JB051]
MHWIARITCTLSLLCLAITPVTHAAAPTTGRQTVKLPPVLITPPVTLDAATWQIQPQRTNLRTIPFADCYEGKYHGYLQKMDADPTVPFYAEY